MVRSLVSAALLARGSDVRTIGLAPRGVDIYRATLIRRTQGSRDHSDDWRTPRMSQPLLGEVPPRNHALSVVPMQRRVQFVALMQLAERGTVNVSTTATICPGRDRRDLESALGYMLDDGSISGPTWRLESLAELARAGLLKLTARGQRWLDEDEI